MSQQAKRKVDAIYVPREGMPIMVPKTHIWAKSVLEDEFEYTVLPATDELEFWMYEIVRDYPGRNNWISNILKAVNSYLVVCGPVLVVVVGTKDIYDTTETHILHKAGDPVEPTFDHIQLLIESLSSYGKLAQK